jgi:hypothetical protein
MATNLKRMATNKDTRMATNLFTNGDELFVAIRLPFVAIRLTFVAIRVYFYKFVTIRVIN